jgi:hypothetical protein
MAHGKRRRDSIHETPDVSYITNPDVAHEESDVAVRPLLWFVGGLTFFTIIVCLSMYLMFQFFKGREESQELAASPLARQGAERLPPEPRLQLAPGWSVETDGKQRDLSYGTHSNYVPQPWSEYLLVNEQWQRELHDYGWADQQAGTARIPVERAIDLYLERRAKSQPPPGAQPPPAANADPSAPRQTQPSYSSSGQQPEQKHQ